MTVRETLLDHAPLTQWASKVAVARMRRVVLLTADDFVPSAFGSDDFHRAIAAFGDEQRVSWEGR